MDEQRQEIDRLENIRTKLSEITDSLSFGKNIKKHVGDHPVKTVGAMILIGLLTAILSTALIRIIFILLSFSLRLAAFIFVVKQSLSKVSGILKLLRNFKKK